MKNYDLPWKGVAKRSWDNFPAPEEVRTEDLFSLLPEAPPPPYPPVVFDRKTIRLKEISRAEKLSRETNCFHAEIWFKGKPVAAVRNDGHGGAHIYDSLSDGGRRAVERLREWALSLPPQSGYDRFYAAMLTLDDVSNSASCEDDSICRPVMAVDLDAVVDLLFDWELRRLLYKPWNRHMVEWRDGKPLVFKWSRTPSDRQLDEESHRIGRRIVPVRAFLDIPPVYFPAPHPFAVSCSDLRMRVKASGFSGSVKFAGVTDERVRVHFDDGKAVDFAPEELEFEKHPEVSDEYVKRFEP